MITTENKTENQTQNTTKPTFCNQRGIDSTIVSIGKSPHNKRQQNTNPNTKDISEYPPCPNILVKERSDVLNSLGNNPNKSQNTTKQNKYFNKGILLLVIAHLKHSIGRSLK